AETLMNDKSRGPRHNSLTIQSHDYITLNLSKYCNLSLWVKEMDPNRHLEVQSFYVAAKEPIYKKETKEYLQQMRLLLSKRELAEEANYEFRDSGSGKIPLEESFNHCLRTIVPLIVNEQKFMADFFHLAKKDSKSSFYESEVFLKDLDDNEKHSMNGADQLEIRQIVNSGYEKIVKTMFDCLEAISKDEESPVDDREQLNAHIMTLGNISYILRFEVILRN
ncbi:17666_t:CDS:2, partial [Racocetra fulgida]